MEGFAKLLGVLIAAAVVCAALAGVAFLITAVVAFWPIIVGFGVLLFLGYAMFVGLVHIAAGKVKALIVAEDASERFKETMMKEAAAKGIPVYTRLTKDALGQCLGKEYRAAAAILDEGFAKALGEKLQLTAGCVARISEVGQ